MKKIKVTVTYSGLTEKTKEDFNKRIAKECKNGRTDCDVECNKKID